MTLQGLPEKLALLGPLGIELLQDSPLLPSLAILATALGDDDWLLLFEELGRLDPLQRLLERLLLLVLRRRLVMVA